MGDPPIGPPTLAAEWASFESTHLAGDFPRAARTALRQAFYSGATSLFALLVHSGGNPVRAESIADELRRFGEAQKPPG